MRNKLLVLLLVILPATGHRTIEYGRPEIPAYRVYQAELVGQQVQRNSQISSYQRILIAIAESVRAEVSDSVSWAIAEAIQKDSEITDLAPTFYLGLLRVENPQLAYQITNWYGASGLTQVVLRFHEGRFPECGENFIEDIYTQICYGARIYLDLLDRYGDPTYALWAYNGCSEQRRLNKERCRFYPTWVMNFSEEYEEAL